MSRIEEALRRASQAANQPRQSEPLRVVELPVAAAPEPAEAPLVDEYRSEEGSGPTVQEGSGRIVEEGPALTVHEGSDPTAEEESGPTVHSRSVQLAEPKRDKARPAMRLLPHRKERINPKLIVSEAGQPFAVEQYRKLAAALHQVQVERGTRIVMVTSAMAGEGKTLTATNLALTLSESFRRQVLLIDADLRRPTIHELFQISNAAGLNDGLKAEQEGKLPLVEVSPHLTVLPAGGPNSDPMGGLASDRMRRIIEEASAKFEWVVLDTPPVGLLPDANLLAEMVDMVVLVIGAGVTPFRLVQRAVQAMDRNRIVGVVLNRADEALVGSQYYYTYYAPTGS